MREDENKLWNISQIISHKYSEIFHITPYIQYNTFPYTLMSSNIFAAEFHIRWSFFFKTYIHYNYSKWTTGGLHHQLKSWCQTDAEELAWLYLENGTIWIRVMNISDWIFLEEFKLIITDFDYPTNSGSTHRNYVLQHFW